MEANPSLLVTRLTAALIVLAPSIGFADYPSAVWPAIYRSLSSMAGGPDSLPKLVTTNTTTPNGDTGQARDIPIPFGFRFFGSEPYDRLHVGAKGYLTFGTHPTDSTTLRTGADYLLLLGAPKSVIAAWWGDHYCPPESGLKTKTLGVKPNRQFVIEWDGCSRRLSQGGTATTFEAQVWLYEGSDVIQVHYGAIDVDPAHRWTNLSWGLKPAAAIGRLGPSWDGEAETCTPLRPDGGKPACSEVNFPSHSVIQYGLFPDADLSGRVKPGALSVSPVSFELDVSTVLLNAGAALVPDVGFDLYLATSPSAEPGAAGAYRIFGHPAVLSLGGGEAREVSVRVSGERPPNGSYRVCALVDPSNSVQEAHRSNNWVCSRDARSFGPDLVGTIGAPPVGEPGATVSIPITVRNQGTDPAGTFRYQILMRPVEQEQGLPTEEVHTGRIEGVAAGGVFEEVLVVSLPGIIRADSYVFELTVDVDMEVAESDRGNNTSVSIEKMVNHRPRLAITWPVDFSLPDGCFYGEPVEATIEVCNQGTARAVDFRPGIIMGDGVKISAGFDPAAAASPQLCSTPGGSACEPIGGKAQVCAFEFCRLPCGTDADCGPVARSCREDPLLAESLGVGSAKSCMNRLESGSAPRAERCQTFELKGTIPLANAVGIPFGPGIQRFHLIDDVLHSLSQPVPDVIASEEYACRPSLLDLAAVGLEPRSPLIPGKAASVARLIRNEGFTNLLPDGVTKAEREHFTYGYYLSTTPDISARKILLPLVSTAGVGRSSIARKGIDQATDWIRIPHDLRPGSYYFGLVLDPENELEELDKRNNVYVSPQMVTVEAGGLEVLTKILPRANVGAHYSHSFVAASGTGPYGWSADNLPPGMRLSVEGLLEGVPTEVGIFPFTVRVVSSQDSASRPLALQVLPGQSELEVTTGSLPIAIRGSLYGSGFVSESGGREPGVQLAAVGGQPPYRWDLDPSLEDNRMPEGLEGPTTDGWISGQPTPMSQSRRFLVRLVDSLGNQAHRWLEITVVDEGTLALPSRPFPMATTGEPYEGCVQAQGGDGVYEWDVGAATLPPGLVAGPRGARLCLVGTPAACGNFDVPVRVGDGQGQSASAIVSLSVDCGLIQLNARSLRPVHRGEEVEFELGASPSRAPTFRLYRGRLPSGLSLSAAGVIAGTVADDASFGLHDAIVEISDIEGRRGLAAISLMVSFEEARRLEVVTSTRPGCSSAGGSPLLSLALAVVGLAILRGGSSAGRAGGGKAAFHAQAFAVILTCGLACGDDTVTTTTLRCAADSTCPSGMTFDEIDCACKCGGIDGMVCYEGDHCVRDPYPRCVSAACEFVSCDRGQTCDSETGLCQCGAEVCGEDERCVGEVCTKQERCEGVSCPTGTICDSQDGRCKCGEEVCEASEICIDEACVLDRCSGVSCGANSRCDPDDGICRCGSGSLICTTGEACLEVEGALACAISTKCDLVTCLGGTLCDPEDGLCRCGGVGTAHPACEATEYCADGECRGGDLCMPGGVAVACAPGLDCDPMDGLCKCGGKFGTICGAEEVCTSLEGRSACTRSCTLLAVHAACGADESCYFDPEQRHERAFCATTGTGRLGDSCGVANDCGSGLHCSLASKCAQLCEVSEGAQLCKAVEPGFQCVPFAQGAGFGYCR